MRAAGFHPWFPLGAGDLSSGKALETVAARHGVTSHQVAIAWLLQRADNVLPIPGTSSVQHLSRRTWRRPSWYCSPTICVLDGKG